ncbi:MAG: S8 family serine peptidase [Natronospirillum sp.]
MTNQSYVWILLTFLLSFSLAAAPRSPSGLPAPDNRPDHVQGELLVKFRAQTDVFVQGSFMAELSARDHKPLPIDRVHLVTLPRGADAMAMASSYANDPRIEYAQPNYLYYSQAVPNDADYGKLWGLNNTGQAIFPSVYDNTSNPGTPGADINAEAAWDLQTDCRSTTVAVLDTGINYTHEDLAANMWDGGVDYPNHGWDFVDGDPGVGDNDPIPSDGASHGTHVAGTIGAVGNNGIGTSGVCWQASIMSVRVLGPNGGTTSGVIQGIDFAVQQGAKVINMSLGGGGMDGDLFDQAIADAGAAGVLVVVAAGNGGGDRLGDDIDNSTPVYPCAYANDNSICAAALDQAYSRATFSNYGATSVDVGAPGTNIQSAVAGEVITDDFSGWRNYDNWAVASPDFFCSEATSPSLVNPFDFCQETAGPYANEANDVAYRQFDLSSSSILEAGLTYYAEYYLNDSGDSLAFNLKPDGGDPFASGTPISVETGPLQKLKGFSHGLNSNSCLTATCSIGFRLQSDTSGTHWGARVFGLQINTVIDGATTYSLYNGTSMATPHVAGLAALLWSYHPDYTYADIANSILNSGDAVAALSNTTTSGRAIDAYKALNYIQAPTGVSASIQ